MKTKWQFFREHFWANVLGCVPALIRHPVRFWPLLAARVRFFHRRTFRPVASLEGEEIRSAQELLSYWEIFIEQALEGRWIRRFREQLMPVVLDVGANHGVFARYVISHNGTALVHAFEPNRVVADALEETMICERVHKVALSNTRGETELHIAGDCGHIGTHFGAGFDRVQPVQLALLDDYTPEFPKIDLLKIDVDGHALEVLEGALLTLEHTETVLIELDPKEQVEDCFKILEMMGFHLAEKLDSINYLFEKRQRPVWTKAAQAAQAAPLPSSLKEQTT